MELAEVRSGPAKVVTAGSVISFRLNPVEIAFGPEDQRLTLVLTFIDDSEPQEPRIEGEVEDDGQTLRLKLINFNGPLGTVTNEPVPIGTLAGRRLYIHLVVYSARPDGDRLIHYTVYCTEEVEPDE